MAFTVLRRIFLRTFLAYLIAFIYCAASLTTGTAIAQMEGGSLESRGFLSQDKLYEDSDVIVFNVPERKWTFRLVHKTPFNDQIGILTSDKRSGFSLEEFTEAFQEKLAKLPPVRAVMDDRHAYSVSLRHYSLYYAWVDPNSFRAPGDLVERHLFESVGSKPRNRDSTSGLIFKPRSIYALSAREVCIGTVGRDAETILDLAAICPQANLLDHALSDYGYLSATLLERGSNFIAYKSEQLSSDLRPTLVIEFDVGQNEEMFDLARLPAGQMGDWTLGPNSKALIERLAPELGVQSQAADVHFIAKGVIGRDKFSRLVNSPLVSVTIYFGSNDPFYSLRTASYSNDYVPKNKLTDLKIANAEADEIEQRTAKFRSLAVSDETRLERIHAARSQMAARYGYEYREPGYFQPHLDWYKAQGGQAPDWIDPIRIDNYINGQFGSTVEQSDQVVFYSTLIAYVDTLYAECPQNLPRNAETVELYTEIRWLDKDGRQRGNTQKENSRLLSLDPRFSAAYKGAFEKSFSRIRRGNEFISALAGMGNYSWSGELRNEERHAVDWLFEMESCDSAIIEQLGENLLRISQGKSSLQAEQMSSSGTVRPNRVTPTEPTLIVERLTTGGTVEMIYSDAPLNWVPSDAAALNTQINQVYRKKHIDPDAGTVPPTLKLNIDLPGPSALQSLRLSHLNDAVFESPASNAIMALFGPADASPPELAANIDFKGALAVDFAARRKAANMHIFVECIYEDGKQLAFWLRDYPVGFSPAELKSVYERHPLLVIGAPRKTCPSTSREF